MWCEILNYGVVWVLNDMLVDWVLYYDGYWIWQVLWGWIWVDDVLWGFVLYYYGCWVYVDDSWVWVFGLMVVSQLFVYVLVFVVFVGGGGGGGFDWNVVLMVGGVVVVGCVWFVFGLGELWYLGWGGWSLYYYECVNCNIVVNNVNVNKIVNVMNIINIININKMYVNFCVLYVIMVVLVFVFVYGQLVVYFLQYVDLQ